MMIIKHLALLIIQGLALSSLVASYSTDDLDAAILHDLLHSYITYVPTSESVCPSTAEQTTTFTNEWPGPNPNSDWDDATVQDFEQGLFQTMMTHTDVNTNTSWSIRIGTSGSMYSHYVPDMWGETMPPQKHYAAPWIDEVHQTVAVNQFLNGKYDECYDALGTVVARKSDGSCPSGTSEKLYFLHQAGAYQDDSPYVIWRVFLFVPFVHII